MLDIDVGDTVKIDKPEADRIHGMTGRVLEVMPHPYNKFDEEKQLVGAWHGLVYLPRFSKDVWIAENALKLVKRGAE